MRDTGVGTRAVPRKPGLGTGIIDALAGRLVALVAIAPANPGTRVSITHAGKLQPC
jgi:hypothetical protein